jgi:hypothetical protein
MEGAVAEALSTRGESPFPISGGGEAEMDETRALLAEMAGIIEDICRNQAKTLRKVAEFKGLPDGLREELLDRAKYMELSHHKIGKFIEKVQSPRAYGHPE